MQGTAHVYALFEYPECGAAAPAWSGWEEAPEAEVAEEPEIAEMPEEPQPEAASVAEWEQRVAEEAGRGFASGRGQGIEEGRKAEREAQGAARKAAEEERARQSARLVEEFARERDRYLGAVENEVVRLALAVAARILRREAQMDPLLLMGAVRVALGQLAATTEVKLRVPPTELDLWTEALRLIPNLAVKPTVVAGDGMRLGDCMVETELGSIDLGVRSQLAEIERGFFDRAGGAGSREMAVAESAA